MQITAAMVKELRERTGVGMMDCKKALLESKGDIEAAIELMRVAGLAKAAEKAGRIAADGVIAVRQTPNAKIYAMVEVNSETDFVAKSDDFTAFAEAVAACVLANRPKDIVALMKLPLAAGTSETVEVHRQQLVTKLGENISVRRFTRMESAADYLGVYLHGSRIGVLVDVKGGHKQLAKDLAMHIAASRPVCVSEKEMPPELLEKEREILKAQAADSGKPPDIIDKMVSGRLKRFMSEVTLLGQPFVKDTEMTVSELLKASGASVRAFSRFEVGEGIDKKTDNFAQDVMVQVRGG
ncbi:MAG: translation elongation factor Ts [Gammaproteobacteria bacterium]|nr:translation elongation factor Ts [Gammaproteobacteria bacterium]MCI0590700.1 translation elongation factor Ts [Gammaproteobacteria bacterium]